MASKKMEKKTEKKASPSAAAASAANASRKITRTKVEAPMIVRQHREPSQEEIARRAYLFYEQRGYVHGNDLADWLQAKKELQAEL